MLHGVREGRDSFEISFYHFIFDLIWHILCTLVSEAEKPMASKLPQESVSFRATLTQQKSREYGRTNGIEVQSVEVLHIIWLILYLPIL